MVPSPAASQTTAKTPSPNSSVRTSPRVRDALSLNAPATQLAAQTHTSKEVCHNGLEANTRPTASSQLNIQANPFTPANKGPITNTTPSLSTTSTPATAPSRRTSQAQPTTTHPDSTAERLFSPHLSRSVVQLTRQGHQQQQHQQHLLLQPQTDSTQYSPTHVNPDSVGAALLHSVCAKPLLCSKRNESTGPSLMKPVEEAGSSMPTSSEAPGNGLGRNSFGRESFECGTAARYGSDTSSSVGHNNTIPNSLSGLDIHRSTQHDDQQRTSPSSQLSTACSQTSSSAATPTSHRSPSVGCMFDYPMISGG